MQPGHRKALQIPMTLFLLAAMLLVFSLMSTKFMTVSNVMNVITQCASGTGIIAIASFMAICSTGVDLSLGGIVSLTGMVTAKVLTWDLPVLNAIRETAPGQLLLIAILGTCCRFRGRCAERPDPFQDKHSSVHYYAGHL